MRVRVRVRVLQMALRKKLHNQLVDLRGNIRVFGRVRCVHAHRCGVQRVE